MRFLRELRILASSGLVLSFSMWTFFWEIFREVGIIDTFNKVRPLRFLRELRIWASSDLVLGFSMWTFFWEIFREVGIIDTFYGGEIIQPALSKKSYRLGLLNMAIEVQYIPR